MNLSVAGWLALTTAALLAWAVFPALLSRRRRYAAPSRLQQALRLGVSLAVAALVGIAMLHPPQALVDRAVAPPEPVRVPALPEPGRKAAPKPAA